jgi:hypothetical protein
MNWPLLILSAVLIALGAEALWLFREKAQSPRTGEDKALWGETPPEVSDALRASVANRVVVRLGWSTRVVAVGLISLGLAVGTVGAGILI